MPGGARSPGGGGERPLRPGGGPGRAAVDAAVEGDLFVVVVTHAGGTAGATVTVVVVVNDASVGSGERSPTSAVSHRDPGRTPPAGSPAQPRRPREPALSERAPGPV